MSRWQWVGRQWLLKLGWPGVLGLLMLTLAILLQLLSLNPARQQLSALQQNLIKPQTQVAMPVAYFPAQQIDSFYAYFPQRESLAGQVRLAHEVAAQHELIMGKVDYRVSVVSGTPIKRYQLTYSVTAEYPTIRRYIAALMQSLPNAVIEGIELQRFDKGAEMVDATINLSLLFRDSP